MSETTDFRCEVTGNPCGTDTRPAGSPCQCKACRRWSETTDARALTLVSEANPEPHARYLVRRGSKWFTATPCYGMHAPWWVVATMAGEAEPVPMADDDAWTTVNALEAALARETALRADHDDGWAMLDQVCEALEVTDGGQEWDRDDLLKAARELPERVRVAEADATALRERVQTLESALRGLHTAELCDVCPHCGPLVMCDAHSRASEALTPPPHGGTV